MIYEPFLPLLTKIELKKRNGIHASFSLRVKRTNRRMHISVGKDGSSSSPHYIHLGNGKYSHFLNFLSQIRAMSVGSIISFPEGSSYCRGPFLRRKVRARYGCRSEKLFHP